jgi:hypothetical protein
MTKPTFEAPKPPRIPSAGDSTTPNGSCLDGWEPSEGPYKGRFVDVDDENPNQEIIPIFTNTTRIL